jgi:hypothetical protein
MMQTKELDMLIIHVGIELRLHETLCHFLRFKKAINGLIQENWADSKKIKMDSNNNQGLVHVIKAIKEDN